MSSRILLVEDEPGLVLTVSDLLSTEGYDVESAADGENGLSKAINGKFDLVILDIMLPRKTGFDVCRELRQKGIDTAILMLTAKTQVVDRVVGLKLGADDYLTKPFGVRELRARVAALLRRSQPPPVDRHIRIGETDVDFNRAEVKRGGITSPLTALEYKLLQLFVRNRGCILTRDQLVEGAWGVNTFVSERVVDNHIGNLRKKIEADADHPQYLVNVRGIGYRFD